MSSLSSDLVRDLDSASLATLTSELLPDMTVVYKENSKVAGEEQFYQQVNEEKEKLNYKTTDLALQSNNEESSNL